MSAAAYIRGVGMVPFGRHRDTTITQLGQRAAVAAIRDAGLTTDGIGEAFVGSGYGGPLIGQRILARLGLGGIPITNVENACSSGSTALREAVAAVQTGRARTVLVLGVDQLSALGGGTLPLASGDDEVRTGMTMPASYAMRAQRYLHEHGHGVEVLADVVVKSRSLAADNPHAHMRTPATRADVLGARPIADPLTLLMCCPASDGAVAAVVTADAGPAPERSPRVLASVLRSGRLHNGQRDLTVSGLTVETVAAAYEAAGCGPDEIDLAEVHDAFAVAELMYYEALGFTGRGGGPDLLASGATSRTGRIPVNLSGGLLSRGHPIGATGVAQICEAVWQIRGDAGARQASRPVRTVLTHCTGGGIAGMDHGACTIHLLGVR